MSEELNGTPGDEGRLGTLIRKFQGQLVTVYCSNGAVLHGYANFDKGGWLSLEQDGKLATCNLDFVISITSRGEYKA